MAEFKADVAKAAGTEPAKADDEVDPEAAVTTDEPAASKEEAQPSDALLQDPNKVPEKLTDRPEWQKITAIADKLGPAAGKEARGLLRSMFKTQHELTQQVEQFKPALEVVEEMKRSVGGSEQGFTNMRQLIKHYDESPKDAVPMLEMLLDDARKRAGLVVSSPELMTEEQKLQEQVSNGDIDAAEAERQRTGLLERQQARLLQQQQQTERERQQRQQTEQQQQKAVADLNQTEQRWTADKAKADPDFEAVKGLHDRFTQLNALDFQAKHKRFPNVQEGIALLNKSYEEAKAEAKKFKPAPKPRQAVIAGEGSSGDNRQQPGSELDEFKETVAKAYKRHH